MSHEGALINHNYRFRHFCHIWKSRSKIATLQVGDFSSSCQCEQAHKNGNHLGPAPRHPQFNLINCLRSRNRFIVLAWDKYKTFACPIRRCFHNFLNNASYDDIYIWKSTHKIVNVKYLKLKTVNAGFAAIFIVIRGLFLGMNLHNYKKNGAENR